MKNLKLSWMVMLAMAFLVACSKEDGLEGLVNGGNGQKAGLYAMNKGQLGEWDEGYMQYNPSLEDSCYYVVSKLDTATRARIIYFGQVGFKDPQEGIWAYVDENGELSMVMHRNLTILPTATGNGVSWFVYDAEGNIIKEIGSKGNPVSVVSQDLTRASNLDYIFQLKDMFDNANFSWHQDWGDLAGNVGLGLVLNFAKLGGWEVSAGIEVLKKIVIDQIMRIYYDGCVPEVKKVTSSGDIAVEIKGISNLTDKYVHYFIDDRTGETVVRETPGKVVYMGVAIRKGNDYVTYGNCDNHTVYVPLDNREPVIHTQSNIRFEPGACYYLRPFLICKEVLDCYKTNTARQWFIKYGDTYEFSYSTTHITGFKQNLCQVCADEIAVKATITVEIESLEDVVSLGVRVCDKNGEGLSVLESSASNGKTKYDFVYEGFLDKSLFVKGETELVLFSYARFLPDNHFVDGDFCSKFVKQSPYSCPDENHPHAIDLGLPSGTKWACCNVGASTLEGYGGYYAWGETSEKANYTWGSYIYYDSSTRYCEYIGSNIAGTSYDVAHVKWGGAWKMPTANQLWELEERCQWKWTTECGSSGYWVIGPSGGSIFLPAAGYRIGSSLYYAGSYGSYWSSTPDESDTDRAYDLYFLSDNLNVNWDYRVYGFSVRPVSE